MEICILPTTVSAIQAMIAPDFFPINSEHNQA